MNQYRKKPIVVEAFQMTPERREDNRDWPEWLNRAWNGDPGEPGTVSPAFMARGGRHLEINTLEGVMRIEWGDWIIRGVQGELYPCKPDIFMASYEVVVE